MVMTTGTPPGRDRGAAILCESARGVKAAVDLPIQGQCEPPDDDVWFDAHERRRRRCARHASRSRHRRECAAHSCRARRRSRSSATSRPSPPRSRCSAAARSRPTSSPGLGDSAEAILDICERLVALGVYPFVVPFVPIAGTPLESHPDAVTGVHARDPRAARAMLVRDGGLSASDIKAGCGKCGACSALSTYERRLRGMIFEPFKPFLRQRSIRSSSPPKRWERAGAAALRRAGVLRASRASVRGDDRDAIDDIAIPLVAISSARRRRRRRWSARCAFTRTGARRVVGLAARGCRRSIAASARSARRLIRLAVSSAHARGCRTFLGACAEPERAAVPAPALATLAEVELHGRPHHLMQADLDFYPPFRDAGDRLPVAAEEGRVMMGSLAIGACGSGCEASRGIAAKTRHRRGRGAARACPAQARFRSATTAPLSPTATATCCSPSKASSTNSSPPIRGSPAGAASWSTSPTSPRWADGRSPWSMRSGRTGEDEAAPVADRLDALRRRPIGVPIVGGHTNIRTDRGQLSVAILGRASSGC